MLARLKKLRMVVPVLLAGGWSLASGPIVAGAASEARPVIRSDAETEPVGSIGDAADDAAIWLHPTDPSLSLVVGTDKRAALEVYDLAGRRLQRLEGATNNVDLRYGFPLGDRAVDLVATAERGLRFFWVDPVARRLTEATARPIPSPFYEEGICLYHSPTSDRFYAFTAGGNGMVTQWELFDRAGLIDARPVREFDVGSAVEGCTTDDETSRLYVGEEDVGIWEYAAEPAAGPAEPRIIVDRTGPGGNLVADVEGLAMVAEPGGRGYLVASSQGDNSFVFYRRTAPHVFLGKLRVGTDSAVDGCSDTDGIDIMAAYLGPAFPGGLFICQDGRNTTPGPAGRQNFKFVPLDRILRWGVGR